MPDGFLLTQNDRTLVQDTIRRRSKTTQRLAGARRPRITSRRQGQIRGITTKEIAPDEDIEIENITLLWGAMPDGVEEETTGSPGQYTVANVFKQYFVRGQVVVALETARSTATEVEVPGHSNENAVSYASTDAITDHAPKEAVGQDSGGGSEWWGFNPGEANFVAKTGAGGIAAAEDTGTTIVPGEGSVTLYWPLDPENNNTFNQSLSATALHVFTNAPVSANTIVTLGMVNSLLVVTGEDCPAGGP